MSRSIPHKAPSQPNPNPHPARTGGANGMHPRPPPVPHHPGSLPTSQHQNRHGGGRPDNGRGRGGFSNDGRGGRGGRGGHDVGNFNGGRGGQYRGNGGRGRGDGAGQNGEEGRTGGSRGDNRHSYSSPHQGQLEICQRIRKCVEKCEVIVPCNPGEWMVVTKIVADGENPFYDYALDILRLYLHLPDSAQYFVEPERILRIMKCAVKRHGSKIDQVLRNVVSKRLCSNKSLCAVPADGVHDLDVLRADILYEYGNNDGSRLMREFDKFFSLLRSRPNISTLSTSTATTSDWARPTIGWLSDNSQYELLGNCMTARYSDHDDSYVTAMRSVWTRLAFYWGTAAFWPKCCEQATSGNGTQQNCGNPLHVSTNAEQRSYACTTRRRYNGSVNKCGRRADWRCERMGHDAICSECLRERKAAALCRGIDASTDLYDAQVERVRSVNTSLEIDIKNFATRKASRAEHKVNWATTYRLSVSNLVGIIKVPFAGAELSPSMQVYWGEIVERSTVKLGERDRHMEENRRKKGELTVRPLLRNDFARLPSVSELSFSSSDHLVLIDLKVFAPEVISVLVVLMSDAFRDGMSSIPFYRSICDPTYMRHASRFSQWPGETLFDMVLRAVKTSQLPCIRNMEEYRRNELSRDIAGLAVRKSLDTTQGVAFAAGLNQTLHCTQGPPGTGKSYVGVCLTLALIKVRQALRSMGESVGPIITLSYKNHATDEFLLDILDSREERFRPGELIRIGKSEADRLSPYSEGNVKLAGYWRNEVHRRQATIRGLFMRVKGWKESNSSKQRCSSILSIIRVLEMVDISNMTPEQAFSYLERFPHEDDPNVQPPRIEPGLVTEAPHCHKRQSAAKRLVKLLECWLEGEPLPPQCSAITSDGGRCIEAIESGSNRRFCQGHSCSYDFCSDQRLPESKYCLVHHCRNPSKCEHPHFKDNRFCFVHSCAVCIIKPIHQSGANACRKHLCDEDICGEARMEPLSFCAKHACERCVERGFVSNNSRRSPESSFCIIHKCARDDCPWRSSDYSEYCLDHVCQLCEKEIDEDRPESGLCVGHRCAHPDTSCTKVRAIVGGGIESAYCSEHTCVQCALTAASEPLHAQADGQLCAHHFAEHQVEVEVLAEKRDVEGAAAKQDNNEQKGKKKNKNKKNKQQNNGNNGGNNGDNIDLRRLFKIPTAVHKVKEAVDEHIFSDAIAIRKCSEEDCDEYYAAINEALCPRHLYALRTTQWEAEQRKPCTPVAVPAQVNMQAREPQRPVAATVATATAAAAAAAAPAAPAAAAAAPAPVAAATAAAATAVATAAAPAAASAAVGVKVPAEAYGERVEVDDSIPDAGNGNVPVDELNDDFAADDASDGESVNEEQRHRHDIFADDRSEVSEQGEAGDDTPLLFCQDDDSDTRDTFDFDELDESRRLLDELRTWSWSLDHRQRSEKVLLFIKSGSRVVNKLLHKSEEHIDAACVAMQEEHASVFKNATVVGGTVVGVARRLAALRAAEPFAIIVEEACEVMEPTLVAVLGVKSLQKLELIGDHQQLQAFVNNHWYGLVSTAKQVKVSLFERLVVGQQSTHLHHTIDMQRRMRPCIADITRREYESVVTILDNENTITQRVADRLKHKPLKNYLQRLWHCTGNWVPGILTNVFFWNIAGNQESRPIAGLSACNQMEAETIARLVEYLVVCKVPKECITVITPYAGQRRLLMKLFRERKLLLPRNYNNQNHSNDGEIIVSTVDRYQGDENDIVILSLVRAKPGNRFLELKNRFIVATSRARLGFFVVGSTSAVRPEESARSSSGNKAAHWLNFLRQLEDQRECHSADSIARPRIGDYLPICCPAHKESVRSVSSDHQKQPSSELFPSPDDWIRFCRVPCNKQLSRCGHKCNLPCHFPTEEKHNERCMEPVERKCQFHRDVTLLCHEVPLANFHGRLEEGLVAMACTLPRKVKRQECDHIVIDQCCLINGKLQRPCEEIVADFQLNCGHMVRNPKCSTRARYLQNPPQCRAPMTLKLTCGHDEEVKCYEYAGLFNNPPPCSKFIRSRRPRCKHVYEVKCYTHCKLTREWETIAEHSVTDSTNRVSYLQRYGPSEHELDENVIMCREELEVEFPCGHIHKIECDRAFRMIKERKFDVCKQPTPAECGLCDASTIQVPCVDWNTYQQHKPRGLHEAQLGSQWKGISEDAIPAIDFASENAKRWWELQQVIECSGKLHVARNCTEHHTTLMDCSLLLKQLVKLPIMRRLEPCREEVVLPLSCGHSNTVACSEQTKPKARLCLQKPSEPYTCSGCGCIEVAKTCDELQQWRQPNSSRRCAQFVDQVAYRCGHSSQVRCHERALLMQELEGERLTIGDAVEEGKQYCLPCSDTPLCTAKVNFKRVCGHEMKEVVCHVAFDWALALSPASKPPACKKQIRRVSPLCGHEIKIACADNDQLESWKPWVASSPSFLNLPSGHAIRLPLPAATPMPKTLALAAINCQTLVRVRHEICGHDEQVACSTVYASCISDGRSNKPNEVLRCGVFVQADCPGLCRKQLQVKCGELKEDSSLAKHRARCENPVEQCCKRCGVNRFVTACKDGNSECNDKVTVMLPCQHSVTWLCGHDVDPRSTIVPMEEQHTACYNRHCVECVKSSWEQSGQRPVLPEVLQALAERQFLRALPLRINLDRQPLAIDAEACQVAWKDTIRQLMNDIDRHIAKGERLEERLVNVPMTTERRRALSMTDLQTLALSHDELECYSSLVFVELAMHNGRVSRNNFVREETDFGLGYRVQPLTTASIHRLVKRTDRNMPEILVGLALRANMWQSELPLEEAILVDRSNIGPIMRERGYDSMCLPIASNEGDVGDRDMVFWNENCIIPLWNIRIPFFECGICMEQFARDGMHGTSCGDHTHFICWGCLREYVNTACMPGSNGVTDQGQLRCFIPQCERRHDPIGFVEAGCPLEIVQMLVGKIRDVAVQLEVHRQTTEIEERMRREFEQRERMSLLQREVDALKKQILDQVLTLGCPRCGTRFVDFNGCCALTCSNQRCNAGFCAFCLAVDVGDVHRHVANCRENPLPGQVFVDLERVNQVWNRLRERRIRELVVGKSEECKRLLQDELVPHFREIRLNYRLV